MLAYPTVIHVPVYSSAMAYFSYVIFVFSFIQFHLFFIHYYFYTSLCDEPITRPEKVYGLYSVLVCDLETSSMRRPWPALGPTITENTSIVSALW